jgi:hypothetical protein
MFDLLTIISALSLESEIKAGRKHAKKTVGLSNVFNQNESCDTEAAAPPAEPSAVSKLYDRFCVAASGIAANAAAAVSPSFRFS